MIQLFLLKNILFSQIDLEEYKKVREEAFSSYKDSVQTRYSEYVKMEEESITQFRKNVEKKWQQYKNSTK